MSLPEIRLRANLPTFSSAQFRTALGMFATGVTIVTARTQEGELVGLTANSFNSVSLDPPLVLWSLSRAAASLPAFQAGSHYAINVLGADQQALALRFWPVRRPPLNALTAAATKRATTSFLSARSNAAHAAKGPPPCSTMAASSTQNTRSNAFHPCFVGVNRLIGGFETLKRPAPASVRSV